MEKFLSLKSDQFKPQLTVGYLRFVAEHNDWFEDTMEEMNIDITDHKAVKERDDEGDFAEVYMGGELALWLRDGLVQHDGEKASALTMEDYGWCFNIHYQGREYHIDIWDSVDDASKYDWVIGFKETKPFWKFAMKKNPDALEKLTKVVAQLLDSAGANNEYEWYAQHPQG